MTRARDLAKGTFSGDLTVDTNTLVVDSANNNVGIRTSSPSFEGGTGTGLEINNSSGNGAHVKLTDAASGSGGTNGFDLYAFNTSGYIENYEAGSIVFRNGGTERMRLDSSGNLLLGGATNADNSGYGVVIRNPTYDGANYGHIVLKKTYSGNATGVHFYHNNNNVGAINYSDSATSYLTSSDYRLKEDWQLMSGASERVLALKPVNFAWKVDGSRVDGFLAHEVAEIVPEAISGTKDAVRDEEYEVTAAVEATYDEDGNELTAAVEAVMGTRSVPDMQGIDQSKLVPLLTAALQEALTKIASMETRLAALEAN